MKLEELDPSTAARGTVPDALVGPDTPEWLSVTHLSATSMEPSSHRPDPPSSHLCTNTLESAHVKRDRNSSSPHVGPAESRETTAREERGDAAQKYKPEKVRLLLVAEAPPPVLDRYFFFETVATNDWLFRGVVEVFFGHKPGRQDKREWLARLREHGIFLVDLKLDPVDGSPLTAHVPELVARCQRLQPKCIVLIKVTVYDAAYQSLRAAGLPVVDTRIPFPSNGQQGKFREKLKEALKLCAKRGGQGLQKRRGRRT